jgi:hypothetical protein
MQRRKTRPETNKIKQKRKEAKNNEGLKEKKRKKEI